MHDPQILAFEIKYPWFKDRPWPRQFQRRKMRIGAKSAWTSMGLEGLQDGRSQMFPEGYRETFISIWHVDPEKDGSDDSCGWAYVKLSLKQKEILHNAAWSEGQTPHFLRCADRKWTGTLDEVESLQRGLYLMVCRVLKIKMSWEQICRLAAEETHIRDCIQAGAQFCFLPGYHSNNPKDSKSDRECHFESMLCSAARCLLTEKRSWWKHPKWHFWHWKFQCHPLQAFKRWAFSRCCKCGKRFTWGYAPVTDNWNSKGPRWFRTEKDVYHSDCNSPNHECAQQCASDSAC